ncbi:flavoprotein NADH-dependent oxidoreductase [Mycena sanguinolenta]|nr:flavoprotein NADH-dependent oxidoreductase [Mycena sanguinolenta]
MSALFTPLKLGSTTTSNRIGMSALTRNRSTATVPNELTLRYYVQRAKGGAGLIVSEGVLITQQGTEWQHAPGIWSQAGSKIYAQVLGRIAHPDAPEQITAGVPVYAPSAISARGGKFRFLPGQPGYVSPTEIDDPTKLIAHFKQAVINAKEAGFDGVELHAAAGYLVHQFLDSTSNHRTDKWGVSPENRARFALETLRARGGYNDVGMPLQDTIDNFGYLLREVENLGLSYVTLMRYSSILYTSELRGTQHDVVDIFSPFLTNTPIFVNSNVTFAEAEMLVRSGKTAGVFMGRNWISHPDLVRRIKAGKALDNAFDFPGFHGVEGRDPAVGYVDYTKATY